MNMFQHIAKIATAGAVTVLFAASFAAAQESGRYRVSPMAGDAALQPGVAAKPATPMQKRAPLAAMARAAPESIAHHLILQVNTNDPAAMNLALNNATNVAQYYKDLGEKVKVEVVTFGPGLHMLRDDTSPVKARIEEMMLSTPEVSFKACGNTQERMRKAENKDIAIVPQAEVVKSGVVRVMELQEKGWSYVKP
ncbi:DsrE family protein [Bradyrhizobium sp. AUGA SZCCT0283]|uniref:DsrE family protein n=1 Tax=Bradyrhizobium sp. AUGA SZCCT0283 TaxID=2807671 RepID=UPI001BAA72A8|nr:DsrE family protein [Bradyrhizobium sp. AUGA SZCCT0283]MBR1280051.1 DsrE family protein [Bradyrhizobium sp. AUGA SZCCT0283]